jgi:predicted nucleic acid-binding protein
MKPTVYIETTIIGHLTGRLPKDRIVAGEMLATRKWWDESRGRFELFTSDVVRQEASRGDREAVAERMKMVELIQVVPMTDAGISLAQYLVEKHALPQKARVDAAHVAIAATNGLEYLLTWNCRHLANASLRDRIAKACRDRGYASPTICTPYDLREVYP